MKAFASILTILLIGFNASAYVVCDGTSEDNQFYYQVEGSFVRDGDMLLTISEAVGEWTPAYKTTEVIDWKLNEINNFEDQTVVVGNSKDMVFIGGGTIKLSMVIENSNPENAQLKIERQNMYSLSKPIFVNLNCAIEENSGGLNISKEDLLFDLTN